MSRPSLPPMSSIGQKGPPQSFTAVFAAKQDDRRKQQLAKSGEIGADIGADGNAAADALPAPKSGSKAKGSGGGTDGGSGSLYGRIVAKIVGGLQSCYGTKISSAAS